VHPCDAAAEIQVTMRRALRAVAMGVGMIVCAMVVAMVMVIAVVMVMAVFVPARTAATANCAHPFLLLVGRGSFRGAPVPNQSTSKSLTLISVPPVTWT
jgi:hypothetical protein